MYTAERKGDSTAPWGVPYFSEACPKTVPLLQINGGLSETVHNLENR